MSLLGDWLFKIGHDSCDVIPHDGDLLRDAKSLQLWKHFVGELAGK